MTPLEICREMAERHGMLISDQEADSIIWTHTGFPDFWDIWKNETMEDCMRRQLEDYFGEICSHCQNFATRFFKRGTRKIELTTRCEEHNKLCPINEFYRWTRIPKEEFIVLWIMGL